jgi:hypothetical protein
MRLFRGWFQQSTWPLCLRSLVTEEKRSVVRFLRAKGLNAMDFHKEMFSVYCGKCLSRKAVHSWEVNDMSRNKCFIELRISRVLCFISICDLFTDPSSHTA